MSTIPPPFRRAVLVGVAGVLAGVVVFVGVVLLAAGGGGGVEARLGDDVFRAGDAERLAGAVEDTGPLLLPDVAGNERDIFLQHLAAAPSQGWAAFSAHPPGAGRSCALEWEPSPPARFVDPCTGTTYPPDGEGLVQYPAEVDDEGVVVVDLRQPLP